MDENKCFEDLDRFLRMDTESEKWHLTHPGQLSPKYKEVPYDCVQGEKIYLFDLLPGMVTNAIQFMKESRYTVIPPHRHIVPEITYIYSGKSTYMINGDTVILNEGDMVLLEPDVIHSAEWKGSNDIVINIAMREGHFQDFLSRHHDDDNYLYSFFLDSFNNVRQKNKYVIFRHDATDPTIDITLQSMLHAYFGIRNKAFEIIMDTYIDLLLEQLISSSYSNPDNSQAMTRDDVVIAAVLEKLQSNYLDCNLREIAAENGYNYYYFSTLIRKKCGHTFSELKKQLQLSDALRMLQNTDFSIEAISGKCGFSNLNYFYRCFKNKYNKLPSDFRK